MQYATRYFSNVYWHFTGSPDLPEGFWPTRPADLSEHGLFPKSSVEAADTAKKIMESGELRATARERVAKEVMTNEFCCVTDIPIKDLPHHAQYYGKVAVGFKADAVHRAGFVPVLYFPGRHLPAVEVFVPAPLNPDLVRMAYEFDQFEIGSGSATDKAFQGLMNRAQDQAKEEGERKEQIDQGKLIGNFLVDYVKITDFAPNPSETFYSEREWRKVGPFYFEKDDVEAVVAPREQLAELRKAIFEDSGYPNSLSLLSWEFVEEA